MSARRPSTTVRPSAGRSTTTPMASMSAVVSVMITSITMIIETIAATANVRGAEVERGGDGEPCACPTWQKSDMAERRRDHRPGNEADQDRDAGEEAGQEPVDHQDDRQGDRGEPDVGQRQPKSGRYRRRRRPVDRHRQQRDPDDGDDRPGHDGREEVQQPGEHAGRAGSRQPGDHDGAEDGPQARRPPPPASCRWRAWTRPPRTRCPARSAVWRRSSQTPRVCSSVASPEMSSVAASRYARSANGSFSALPTISGTATTPAYMLITCCSP